MSVKPEFLIRHTFSLATQRINLAEKFYDRLFDTHPDLRHLFPQNMTAQKQKMVDVLGSVVANVDKPDILATILIPLGRRHGPYGAAAKQVPAIISTLATVVEDACDRDWTQEAAEAWTSAFKTVSSLFLTGLAHTAAVSDDTPRILSFAQAAAATLESFSQDKIDAICAAIASVGYAERFRLAEMAVEETGMGRVDSKAIKNELATRIVWEDLRRVKTVGVIGERDNLIEVAKPMGVVLAVIPVTNPTSTTLYKIISALKARNSIIVTGASRAKNCTNEAARLAYGAAIAAGAPPDCIQWVEHPNRDFTRNLMSQKDVAIILATGGEALVGQAYSSGTPSFGVGAGNVPVYVHESADLGFAAEKIIESKNFDYGTICASEQSIVCTEAVAPALRQELEQRGAVFLDPDQVSLLERVAINDRGTMNAAIVGQPARFIADKAGFEVSEGCTLLVAPQTEVGPQAPLSQEILAPLIAWYVEPDHMGALAKSIELNHYGGVGHTAVIYATDDAAVNQFSQIVTAGRILVNMGSSSGAVGIGCALRPSFTLGCGTAGGNITTVNITARDLINVQRVARPTN